MADEPYQLVTYAPQYAVVDICREIPWVKDLGKQIRALRRSKKIYAVTPDGRVIGLVRLLCDAKLITYLCDLYVRPDWRGRGVGRALMDFVLQHPAVKGTDVVLMTTEAAEFYAKFGFEFRQAMIRREAE